MDLSFGLRNMTFLHDDYEAVIPYYITFIMFDILVP